MNGLLVGFANRRMRDGYPVVPENAYNHLNAFQKFFIGTPPDFENGLYSNGWYLIPSLKFINMAICCLIAFLCCFIVLLQCL